MNGLRTELASVHQKVSLYLTVGRFDAAEKLIKSTIAAHGSLANLHNLLGVTYQKQSRFTEAIREFKKALKVNSNFTEAALNLAVVHCDVGQYSDGRVAFESALTHVKAGNTVPDLVLGRIANTQAATGRAYEQAGMFKEAISEYEKALATFPKMPDIRLSLGRLLLKTGNHDKASREFAEILRVDPQNSQGMIWAGIARYKSGQIEEARDFWRQAQRISPADPGARALVKGALIT
jgi:tetratricopeptide (TPR) repeat protein